MVTRPPVIFPGQLEAATLRVLDANHLRNRAKYSQARLAQKDKRWMLLPLLSAAALKFDSPALLHGAAVTAVGDS